MVDSKQVEPTWVKDLCRCMLEVADRVLSRLPQATSAKDDPCECFARVYQLMSQQMAAKAATLMRAELLTVTGDADNKDKDTGIFVSVRTADGASELASISGADSSGKDATEYNDDSYHIVPLVVDAPGATKTDCRRFGVRLWQKTNGSDKWSIDLARVTLWFTDGTNLFAERAAFNLDGDGDAVGFSSV